MGRFAGKLSTVVVIVLFAAGLVSCGGGDEDSEAADTGTTPSAQEQAGGKAEGGAGSGEGKSAKGSGEGESGESESEGSEGSGKSGEGAEDSGSGAADRHEDSGGGSSQFRVQGGDNSIQDYGSEADEPEFDQAAQAVHGFFDARVRGNWEAACSYLAEDVVEALRPLAKGKLADAGCATILSTISQGAPKAAFKEAAKADIGSLRVEEGQAFVLYHGAAGLDYVIAMQREGGEWKVASLAGTPIS